MKLTEDQKKFLRDIEGYNTQYNAIQIGNSIESLFHSFWSIEKILKAEDMKQEWDIPDYLMPFYGDWHDVFCIDIRNNTILMLNDERQIIHQWENPNAFLSS